MLTFSSPLIYTRTTFERNMYSIERSKTIQHWTYNWHSAPLSKALSLAVSATYM